jgi:hypothetical protein
MMEGGNSILLKINLWLKQEENEGRNAAQR